MSEVNETLADIVADIRGRADCAERHGERETHNEAVAALLRSIADRVTMAAKREAAKLIPAQSIEFSDQYGRRSVSVGWVKKAESAT